MLWRLLPILACTNRISPDCLASSVVNAIGEHLKAKLSVHCSPAISASPEFLLVGDSMIRSVSLPRAITFSLSGGKTADCTKLISALLDHYPTILTVIIHIGTNDIIARQSCKLHLDLEALVAIVESLGVRCILSGPIPLVTNSSERFSHSFNLHLWMQNFTSATGYGFISNFDAFWKVPSFYRNDGLHLNATGLATLARNYNNFITQYLKQRSDVTFNSALAPAFNPEDSALPGRHDTQIVMSRSG